MKPITILAVCLLASCACAAPQDPKGQDPARDKQKLLAELAKGGVELDVEKQTITVKAVVNLPADPLEYLLINKRGKAHEALFRTEVRPSLLNGAFLALGYSKGKNASTRPITPMPTEEQIRAGAPTFEVLPPEGMELYITVHWSPADEPPPLGPDGEPVPQKKAKTSSKPKVVAAGDLIVDLTAQKTVGKMSWIYLGGRMAELYRGEPPVFVGDYEGNMVSICYLSPENHLATMRHERAADDQNWWMTELCPPPGTPVKVRFHRTAPDVVVARNARLAREAATSKPAAKSPKK